MENLATIMDNYGSKGVPFFFMVDFETKEPIVIPLSELEKHNILIDTPLFSNIKNRNRNAESLQFKSHPVEYETYRKAFDKLQQRIRYGDSFLANLCFETPIECNYTLTEIFDNSRALYRLFYNDKFIVFSPECFVRIEEGKIYSHPMKGTIDAEIDDAEKTILSDTKETAEHNTIVDLIRNDVGIVSQSVRVNRFRYIDRVNTHKGDILQVSSEVEGILENNYHQHLGKIVTKMLPAGSISGAPKQKTIEIINDAENFSRGYFTGVFGVFDGSKLDSAVMIRFIERKDKELVFKSGGGITINSDCEKEYNEMIRKVYVPII